VIGLELGAGHPIWIKRATFAALNLDSDTKGGTSA